MTRTGRSERTRRLVRTPKNSKVPEIIALFWVIKILTTGMGEVASDFAVHHSAPEVAVAFGFVAFCAVLWWQLRSPRYEPQRYWFAVVMVSVFGTMAADVMHVGLSIPYAVSTVMWATILVIAFSWWKHHEGTLSIHTITTPVREWFYWAAVLATFAFGTALGDMAAVTLHLGYFTSGVMFLGLFCLVGLSYRFHVVGEIPAFWAAYVLTRPLGASFADWVGVPAKRGGLGVGTGVVSVFLAAVVAVLIAYLVVSRADTPTGPPLEDSPERATVSDSPT